MNDLCFRPLSRQANTRRVASFRTRSSRALMPLLGVFCALAGCGGSGIVKNTIPRSQDTPQPGGVSSDVSSVASDAAASDVAADRATDVWPSGSMRIAQSLYLNSMSNDLAGAIGDRLAAAPKSVVPGIGFCPAASFSSKGTWTNALTVLGKLPAGRGVLVVYFGHKGTDGKIKDWADKFYTGVFASNGSKAYFEVSPGNEYSLSNDAFNKTMKDFTDELITQWNNGKDTKGKTFPTAHLHLLQYGYSGSRTSNGFQVDGDTHLPAAGDPAGKPATGLPGGYTLPGNDGQTVTPFAAYNATTGGDLLIIDASKYNGFCKGRSASLWLPPLHQWAYDSSLKKYIASKREDPTGSHRTDMLNAIESFVKTP